MAESIQVASAELSRKERYAILLPQLRALVESESDWLANTSNIIAAIRQTFDFFWIGLYFVRAEELVLGPFQGPVACTRIAYGKGVCGTAWKDGRVMIVPDVDQFPGHIACSSESRSEIVVPVWKSGRVVAVLDVDSNKLNDFGEEDADALQEVSRLISVVLSNIN